LGRNRFFPLVLVTHDPGHGVIDLDYIDKRRRITLWKGMGLNVNGCPIIHVASDYPNS